MPPADTRKVIRRVFIANRGEIARRIAHTCQRLGIGSVAASADGPLAVDLLDGQAVVGAALATEADAVHPGYGFLAETATFAEAVEAAGLRWIGPPPEAIRAMGDKAAARRLATDLGIPVADGYDGDAQNDATLTDAAARIGFPVLVKPGAGGGGKGMRIVRDRDQIAEQLAAARREAVAAFGDGRLILERFLEGARHVEIQIVFDGHGNGVTLGERDCSIQRRHQKILEEAPSPAVDPALRRRLGAAAVRLAGHVGYVGVGTCEFLVDQRGRFAFLEMNTRLQVEHTVTEMVVGRDLVADQIRIAEGASLPSIGADQSAVDARLLSGGHALEVRLYAEDAEVGFLPATGRVVGLRWPSGPGIRVDAGIDVGSEVGGRFDPLLAKLIGHGPDRSTALERLATALDETMVLGLTTNLRFLRWLVRQPAVVDGLARTDTLERIWPPDDWPGPAAIPDGAWTAAGHALDAGSWRLNGPPVARLVADGIERAVRLDPGWSLAVDVVVDHATAHVDVAGRSIAFRLAEPPDVGETERAARAAHEGDGPAVVTAPMPGLVLAIHRTVGEVVETGDPLVTLEAMKMEHAVPAPRSGRLGEVSVSIGDQVVRGQPLAVVDSL